MLSRPILLLMPLVTALVFTACSDSAPRQEKTNTENKLVYLNHSDSARYVGMQVCRQCHSSVYDSYIQTGMGRSFGIADRAKSSATFSRSSIYDKFADLHYHAFWNSDSLYFKEYRLAGRDTTHRRIERVNYIIGSGQHTNSHIQSLNGYLHQMPMTFYTQSGRWDLPPGFENGLNTRFSRKIGLECMTCHNGYPDFVMGSENKYKAVPLGIDCERCHGPGGIHVAERSTGSRVDTSRLIDYTIVNPAKLSVEAQFDVCQRCHLQGNAVLKEGRSFFDFKPGMRLHDFISVFLPRYQGADDEFIMASHADRLKQSPCFIKSAQKAQSVNTLKPYRDALTCITCHNPHVSVKQTGSDIFNGACLNCHAGPIKTRDMTELNNIHKAISKWDDCVKCHMPVSGSVDIPHVTVHDHFIRKPVSRTEKDKIRKFIGLQSVNERHPDAITLARAYLDQYEKFGQEKFYLDSARHYLQNTGINETTFPLWVRMYFFKNAFDSISFIVSKQDAKRVLAAWLHKKSYDNSHAWTAYRVGEAVSSRSGPRESLSWYQKAVELAPYNLEFMNKLASGQAALNDLPAAEKNFQFILSENPSFVPAYSNLGYINMVQGRTAEAYRLYRKGLQLDPDNEQLLLNLAAYHLYMKNNKAAKEHLQHLLKKHPSSEKARQALSRLNAL